MKKFILILLFFCQIAHADLPLSLEELVTDKGKFKLDSNLSYINREISQKEFAAPLYIQTTNNNLVAVPTILNDTDSNSDVIVGTVGALRLNRQNRCVRQRKPFMAQRTQI